MLSMFQRHASASSFGCPAADNNNGDDTTGVGPLHHNTKMSMTDNNPFTALDLFNPLGPNLLSLLPEHNNSSSPSASSSSLTSSPNNKISGIKPWIVIKPNTTNLHHRRDESSLLTEGDISSFEDEDGVDSDNGEWYVHCSRLSRSNSKASVSFHPAVEVLEIPARCDLDEATRNRLWISTKEREADKNRNMMEFMADGWDWRRATEEHCFARLGGEDGDEYELVHPATWMERMMAMDSDSEKTTSKRRRERRRRKTIIRRKRVPSTLGRRVPISPAERPPTSIIATYNYDVYLGDHQSYHAVGGFSNNHKSESSPAVLLPPSAKHRFVGAHFVRHF